MREENYIWAPGDFFGISSLRPIQIRSTIHQTDDKNTLTGRQGTYSTNKKRWVGGQSRQIKNKNKDKRQKGMSKGAKNSNGNMKE